MMFRAEEKLNTTHPHTLQKKRKRKKPLFPSKEIMFTVFFCSASQDMHKQDKQKAFANISVTNTYVQKIHKRRAALLKQGTWQLTSKQIKPLAGIMSHLLIYTPDYTAFQLAIFHSAIKPICQFLYILATFVFPKLAPSLFSFPLSSGT